MNPFYTRGLEGTFRQYGLITAYTLQAFLEIPKNRIGDKSSIYEISCKDFNKKCIGRTQQSIHTRYMAHLK